MSLPFLRMMKSRGLPLDPLLPGKKTSVQNSAMLRTLGTPGCFVSRVLV